MNHPTTNNIPKIDVEAQWQKFSARHLPHRHRMQPRWVAAACICLVVGVTLAVTLPRLKDNQPLAQANIENSALEKGTTQEASAETAFIFHDVTLQQVLDTLSAYYQVNVIYINKEAAQLRLYTQIEKDLRLSEAVALLNQLGGITLRIENEDTLIVE